MATVSGQSVAPSSSGLEHDARLITTDDHHEVAPGEIAIGVVIGRMAEFFDYFVYGIASVLVFPRVVFPFADPVTAMLYSFAVFALAFIARPIGSVIFMAVDRKHGRGVKLTLALFLLGGSTVSLAFLPEYNQVGFVSILLLCFFRICQGLALGGAWDGLASLLALNAPENRRGWYRMIPQLGAPLGFILASALFAFFVAELSAEDFFDWGWRYPFFVAFAVNVVALFARLRLVATREFEALLERDELQATPVLEMFRAQGIFVLIGAFVPLASYALFHLVTIFSLGWITLHTKDFASGFLLRELACAILGAGAVVLSGVLADKIGRRTLLALSAALIGLFSFFAPVLLGKGIGGETVFLIFGFVLLGLSFGQAAGSVTSNFSRRYRYTGAAMTSDLAWLVGAGFAPLVALGISSRFGLVFVGGYLLSGVICTLAALTINRLQEH